MRSVQTAVRQRPSVPHTPLAQSSAARQIRPAAQGGQGPPQSKSLSVPFLRSSSHVAAAQTPAMQEAVTQSTPVAHGCPMSHGPHGPPQSAPVSPPLLTPSAQVGVMQTVSVHTPLSQSLPMAHV
jgi:hypothetical protein